MRQKHKALFKHFSGICLRNCNFFSEKINIKFFCREREESKLKINVKCNPNTAVYRIVFCCIKTITYLCYFYTINFMHFLSLALA